LVTYLVHAPPDDVIDLSGINPCAFGQRTKNMRRQVGWMYIRQGAISLSYGTSDGLNDHRFPHNVPRISDRRRVGPG
jgi:hypothetical protein